MMTKLQASATVNALLSQIDYGSCVKFGLAQHFSKASYGIRYRQMYVSVCVLTELIGIPDELTVLMQNDEHLTGATGFLCEARF